MTDPEVTDPEVTDRAVTDRPLTDRDLRVAPLDAALFPRWAALFEAAHSPCYCRYWHFTGNKNDWLARAVDGGSANRAEQKAAIAEGGPAASGLVAIDTSSNEEPVVGWMKLAPRAALPKLRGLSVYRAHDLGSDEGVFSVGCFLVHPAYRRRGVARALLGAAPAFVRARGGTSIEAYPRRSREELHDEEALMGYESLFVELGFIPFGGEAPYPVLRRSV